MFDIPEVDYMVFKNLEMNDLIQCGLVCKTWYLAITPLMWQRIPVGLSRTSWILFYEQILQDYLQSLQSKMIKQTEQNQLNSPETPTATEIWQRPDYIPALSKYGPNVREVDLNELWLGLRDANIDMEELHMKGIPDPSALQVFQHFLKRCPNIQSSFNIAIPSRNHVSCYEDPYDFAVAVIPYLRQASTVARDGYKSLISIPSLKRILSAASAHRLENLELRLKIDIMVELDDMNVSLIAEAFSPEPHPVIIARPKKLLVDIELNYPLKSFDWSWLWPICCQVKELVLCHIRGYFLEPLAAGIRDSMPCLDTLNIYVFAANRGDHYDKLYGRILEACPQPLRNLALHDRSILGSHMRMGVLKHAATLESLRIDRGDVARLLEVLRACSSLKGLKIGGFSFAKDAIDATRFADHDPVSGELNTWLCEHTLETLHVVCEGIPEWSPQENPSIRYQREVIQQKLCERLGQFTNLQELQLYYRADTPCNHDFHPTLILGTGLDELNRLKRLKKVHFHQKLPKGVPEIEWILKHWKEVSVIDGKGWSAPARL
ncbi:hypothetical protein BG004_005158 [Podila humilis]|nr:hypothetical protein BG004_005158 [Podila humilis]